MWSLRLVWLNETKTITIALEISFSPHNVIPSFANTPGILLPSTSPRVPSQPVLLRITSQNLLLLYKYFYFCSVISDILIVHIQFSKQKTFVLPVECIMQKNRFPYVNESFSNYRHAIWLKPAGKLFRDLFAIILQNTHGKTLEINPQQILDVSALNSAKMKSDHNLIIWKFEKLSKTKHKKHLLETTCK